MANIFSKSFLIIKTFNNFPDAILDKLGLIHGEILYNLRNNTKFYARGGTEDMAEIAVVGSGSEYNLDLLKLTRNPLIVDLGGHIGTFSIPIAKKMKNKCKIYVFEPDKNNFKLLKRNIALNKTKSIFPKNIAISDKVGYAYLKTEKMNTDAYFLDDSRGKFPNCKISTLDKAIPSNKTKIIDLLKIDIEGGEYKILQHKKSISHIEKYVHYIFIEHHPINSRLNGKFVKRVLSKNFNILSESSNTFTFENKNWRHIKN